MSEHHPNTQLIRDFHDCQNRFYAGGDQEPVRAMLTKNVIWHVPGASAIAGDYRGRDEVLRYFARRRELADATFRIDVRGVLADFRRKATSPTQTLTRAATACACQADVGRYANFTVRVATTLPSISMLNTTRPRPSWRSARLDR